MKHLTALLLAAAALPLQAAELPKSTALDAQQARIYFGTLKQLNGVSILNPKETFSRSKGDRFCWLAENLPNGMMEVREHHRTSQASQLVHPQLKITSSPDQTEHTAVYPLAEFTPQTQRSQCWSLDKTDPLGRYILTVQIGENQFTPWQFEVVE